MLPITRKSRAIRLMYLVSSRKNLTRHIGIYGRYWYSWGYSIHRDRDNDHALGWRRWPVLPERDWAANGKPYRRNEQRPVSTRRVLQVLMASDDDFMEL